MNKVTTINLNGRAYNMEEAGYEVLRKYLDQAAAKLEGNPDKDEIMADFEQAIAEKCGAYLNGAKDVITEAEIEAIIAKMGPVETGSEHQHGAGASSTDSQNGASSSSTTSANSSRRLYRIMEGSWIAGVSTGLAAYLNVKTSWVRIGFLVLSGATHGFALIIYILLAVFLPVARTEEEHNRARGQAPFTANEFIEQAKQRYAEFQKKYPNAPATPQDPHNKEAWRNWKREMKDWKRQWKYDRHAEKFRRRMESASYGQPSYNHEVSGAGFFRFILGVVIFALFAIWILALLTLVKTGLVLGYPILAGVTAAGAAGAAGAVAHPLLLAIVFLTALFYLLVLPLKLLMKNARPYRWGHYSFFNDLVQSLFFVFALYLLIYTARILFPQVGEAWNVLIASVRGIR